MAKTFKIETWESHGVKAAKVRMYDDKGEQLQARGIPYILSDNAEYLGALKVIMEAEYDVGVGVVAEAPISIKDI